MPDIKFIILNTADTLLIKYIAKRKFGKLATDIKYIEDLSKKRFKTASFLQSNNKQCYYSDDIDYLIKNETLWKSIQNGSYLNGNALIIYTSKLDSRTKFAKKFKSHIYDIDITKLNINKVVTSTVDLSSDLLSELFENCQSNFTILDSEMNKINAYAAAMNIDVNESYTILKSANNLPVSVNDDTFNLVDDIMSKRIDIVYHKLHILDKTDFDFGLFTILYNNFRNLFIYIECLKNGNMSNSGLNSYVQKSISKYVNLYSAEKIVNLLDFFDNLDYNLKVGNVDSNYALDYMLMEVFT